MIRQILIWDHGEGLLKCVGPYKECVCAVNWGKGAVSTDAAVTRVDVHTSGRPTRTLCFIRNNADAPLLNRVRPRGQMMSVCNGILSRTIAPYDSRV